MVGPGRIKKKEKKTIAPKQKNRPAPHLSVARHRPCSTRRGRRHRWVVGHNMRRALCQNPFVCWLKLPWRFFFLFSPFAKERQLLFYEAFPLHVFHLHVFPYFFPFASYTHRSVFYTSSSTTRNANCAGVVGAHHPVQADSHWPAKPWH